MEPADDAILGVLHLGGGSGTATSIRETFDTNRDDVLDDLPDDTDDTDLDDVDVKDRLRQLRDLRLVEYDGHGEFEITSTGRSYIDGSFDLEGVTVDRSPRTRLVKWTKRNYWSIALLAGVLLLVGGTLFYIWDIRCQAGLAPILVSVLIIPILATVVVAHTFNRGKWLTKFLIRRLNGGDNPSEGDIDAAAAAVANSFRSFTVFLLAVILAAGVIIETNVGLGTQYYGLVFDLFGGVFLAIQATKASPRRLRSSGMDMPWENFDETTAEVTDGIWGIGFLMLGFGIQGLSQIPWHRILPSTGVC
jgi:hypothetical protein